MSTVPWRDLKKKADDALRPPEPGWYVLECVKADAKQASTTGNPMIAAQFKIAEGPAAGKTGIFNNFNLTPDNDFALGLFFKNLAAFGIGDAFWESNPTVDQVAETLVGRRANVKLSVRSWQGRDMANFDEARPIDGSTPASAPVAAGIPTGLPSASPVSSPEAVPASPGNPPVPAF